jgi:ankyrin repeat protein
MNLIYACQKNPVNLKEIERLIINEGVNINHNNNYTTPLISLCYNTSITLELLKYMVENGANINDKNTSLVRLCQNESVTLDMVKYMIEHGENINHIYEYKNTPLIFLCGNNSVTLDMLKYMVENGANINHNNMNGDRPIFKIMFKQISNIDYGKIYD